MGKRLSSTSVACLAIATVLLIASIFLPWWGMRFVAPQYPEGLDVIVYPYKMDGKLDIINGLNHYIGMTEISEEGFKELEYLPYLIGGMAFLTLITAISRKRFMEYITSALFTFGGVAGLYDIHRWLTNFGTNLDPKAPIKIAPFVPPVLGVNKIANFTTTSYFTYGSFLLGLAFLLIVYSLWKDRAK